jgi:hypothetical protein
VAAALAAGVMSARQWIGPVLVGAAVGTLGIVGYDCLRSWYVAGNGNPLCVYDFKHYVLIYEREHGRAEVTCRYDPNFPADVLGAP